MSPYARCVSAIRQPVRNEELSGPGRPSQFRLLPSPVDRAPSTQAKGHPLRHERIPDWSQGSGPLRVVDLFCGLGGLSLGVAQAARSRGVAVQVPLAVDLDVDALRVYEGLFGETSTVERPIEELVQGVPGSSWTAVEQALEGRVRDIDVLLGGPPCQGHSDLNNHTRRLDPRNEFYLVMARAAELLRPSVVVVENVPTVQRDKGQVARRTAESLCALGYSVADRVVPLVELGVAQRRRRHVLLAVHPVLANASSVLDSLSPSPRRRTVAWAIADLVGVADPAAGLLFDRPSKPSALNKKRMELLQSQGEYELFDAFRPPCHQGGGHSYGSMYGRLRWDEPAQTITSGFSSPGQGRYVHPSEARTITPHEAARLQGLPDYVPFETVERRGSLARMIGNAVPPALGRTVLAPLIDRLVPGGNGSV